MNRPNINSFCKNLWRTQLCNPNTHGWNNGVQVFKTNQGSQDRQHTHWEANNRSFTSPREPANTGLSVIKIRSTHLMGQEFWHCVCDIKREVYYEKRHVIAKHTMCIGVRERSGVRGREREDFLTELATKTRCLPPVSTPLSPSLRCSSHPPQACVSSKAYLTLCSHSERLPW